MKGKVVIIGCGNVGMSYAYALLNQKSKVCELALIDLDKKKIEGEVMDLSHCLAFLPGKIKVKVGDYKDCLDADIVMIAAGAKQENDETRMDLINKNSVILKKIVEEVVRNGFKGIFIVATNPVDIMTYVAWKVTGFDYKRVIGTGTSLDTARLRYLIGKRIKIDAKNIHAYVIGEHGDSEFVPWSGANVGLQNINNFLNKDELEEVCSEVRGAAYEIIKRKGNTCYGIGVCLVKITNAILNDENSIVTVSSYDEENDIFIGLPSVLNKNGAERRIYVELNEEETEKLQNSVDVLKEAKVKINL